MKIRKCKNGIITVELENNRESEALLNFLSARAIAGSASDKAAKGKRRTKSAPPEKEVTTQVPDAQYEHGHYRQG
jgi:hypothetical protein